MISCLETKTIESVQMIFPRNSQAKQECRNWTTEQLNNFWTTRQLENSKTLEQVDSSKTFEQIGKLKCWIPFEFRRVSSFL